jgi:hypothetical protein
MRSLLLALAVTAAPLAAQLPTPTASTQPTRPAPVWCESFPNIDAIEASPTRFIVQREIATTRTGACVGVATRVKVGARTRYRVDWMPCRAGQPWRRGDDFPTMSAAMVVAARPPACP